MKKLVFVASFMFLVSGVFAQYALPKGGKQLNAGLGLYSSALPLYVGLDYGVHKDISVGGELSIRSTSDRWGNSNYNLLGLGFLINGNYHFNSLLEIPKEFDFYAGLSFGFFLWNHPNGYNGTYNNGPGFAGQVGGRYYFNNRWALNLELGGGTSTGGKFGITYKL
jgi:outer membrane immunogenic protein